MRRDPLLRVAYACLIGHPMAGKIMRLSWQSCKPKAAFFAVAVNLWRAAGMLQEGFS
jgi:hypothetical protein